jgi:hypothetical protein
MHIRVNSICPSWVSDSSGVVAMPGEFGEHLLRNIPAGRHVTPEDVANLVAFLCSPESAQPGLGVIQNPVSPKVISNSIANRARQPLRLHGSQAFHPSL